MNKDSFAETAMTSPASGPYQSRFFNFLLRQTRRVANECDRALRHAKVATVWGVQLLLSPAFWFFGSDRQNVQPLSGKPQPKRSLFSSTSANDSSPSVDYPLEQVFQTLQETAPQTFQLPAAETVDATSPWQKLTRNIKQSIKIWFGSKPIVATPEQSPQLSQITVHNPAHLAESPPVDYSLHVKSGKLTSVTHPVRGIATLLNNRELVLVTPNNDILDCLTSSQKQLLAQRIEAEITAYLQAVQIHLAATQKWIASLPPFLQKIAALPSVQNVQKLLPRPFIKSALAPADDAETLLLSAPIHPWLKSLDQALVKLEQAPLHFPAKVPFNLSKTSTEIADHFPSNFSTLGEQISHLPEQVKVLLHAAIQYFFGVKPQSPLQATPTAQSLSGKTELPSLSTQMPIADLPSALPDLDDPWLTEEELFGQAIVQEVKELSGESSSEFSFPALPENQTLNWGKSLINLLKQKLQFSKHSPESTAIQKIDSDVPQSKDSTEDLTPIANSNLALVSQTPGKITANSSKPSAIAKPSKSSAKSSKSKSSQKKTIKIPTLSQTSQSTAESESTFPLRAQTAANFATHSPDWIDTEARTMGYVKHPLEALLECLDGIMFWLESLLVNFWSFLKGLFTKS